MSLAVEIGKLKLKNPVIVASGTFGYGQEFEDLIDLSQLGAIVTKSITLKPRPGNPVPRIVETSAGMLNAIGLQNDGLENFVNTKLPYLSRIGIPVIVSIAADKIKDFVELAEKLTSLKEIDALEINLSCPNVEKSNLEFSKDAKLTFKVVSRIRKVTRLPLITKLTPQVNDITLSAKAAKQAGSNAISLVNTFLAMAVDAKTKKPKLANVTGGLSGPCIKPIALNLVWQVHKKVKIPIIGMGGIMNTEDALEFILCGATAVAVGTANFINPKVTMEIIEGLRQYLNRSRIKHIKGLIGALQIK